MSVKEAIDKVHKLYPTAIAVNTTSNRGEEYRIWPTNHPFETRYIGHAPKHDDAWLNAADKIDRGFRFK